MAFCSAGDLSIYIRKRGDLVALNDSNQGLLPEPLLSISDTLHRGREAAGRVMYPHPKEGGLNETIVRCFLGQLGQSDPLLYHLARYSDVAVLALQLTLSSS